MEKRAYRKRFERSSDIPRHRFQEGDLVLLKLVADYRFLDTDLLRILAGRGIRNLRRRLQWLYHAGYLDRPASQQDYPLTRGPMVYTLGRKGATLLSDPRIGYDTGKIDWYTRNRQAKLFFIEHTMMVSRIRATLTLATQALDTIELADWQQGRHLNDRVWVEEYGEELPVAPDGAFSLKLSHDQRGYRHFLLEADRGTMSLQDRMRKKLRAYWRWFREGGHRERLGIEAFRVLTVTNSERRRDNLVELAKQVDDAQRGSHLFLFGYEGDLSLDEPQSIFEEIWRTPADDARHTIVE